MPDLSNRQIEKLLDRVAGRLERNQAPAAEDVAALRSAVETLRSRGADPGLLRMVDSALRGLNSLPAGTLKRAVD